MSLRTYIKEEVIYHAQQRNVLVSKTESRSAVYPVYCWMKTDPSKKALLYTQAMRCIQYSIPLTAQMYLDIISREGRPIAPWGRRKHSKSGEACDKGTRDDLRITPVTVKWVSEWVGFNILLLSVSSAVKYIILWHSNYWCRGQTWRAVPSSPGSAAPVSHSFLPQRPPCSACSMLLSMTRKAEERPILKYCCCPFFLFIRYTIWPT